MSLLRQAVKDFYILQDGQPRNYKVVTDFKTLGKEMKLKEMIKYDTELKNLEEIQKLALSHTIGGLIDDFRQTGTVAELLALLLLNQQNTLSQRPRHPKTSLTLDEITNSPIKSIATLIFSHY